MPSLGGDRLEVLLAANYALLQGMELLRYDSSACGEVQVQVVDILLDDCDWHVLRAEVAGILCSRNVGYRQQPECLLFLNPQDVYLDMP